MPIPTCRWTSDVHQHGGVRVPLAGADERRTCDVPQHGGVRVHLAGADEQLEPHVSGTDKTIADELNAEGAIASEHGAT